MWKKVGRDPVQQPLCAGVKCSGETGVPVLVGSGSWRGHALSLCSSCHSLKFGHPSLCKDELGTIFRNYLKWIVDCMYVLEFKNSRKKTTIGSLSEAEILDMASKTESKKENICKLDFIKIQHCSLKGVAGKRDTPWGQ